MTQEEQEKLLMLLQNSQSGLEKKTTIERVSGLLNQETDDLIKVDKDAHIDENGGIREVNVINIKVYACGCRVDGRQNFGGIDHKGNIACVRHFYRCIRCRRPLSTLTVKPINGFCYCARCVRIVKILRFLGLKK